MVLYLKYNFKFWCINNSGTLMSCKFMWHFQSSIHKAWWKVVKRLVSLIIVHQVYCPNSSSREWLIGWKIEAWAQHDCIEFATFVIRRLGLTLLEIQVLHWVILLRYISRVSKNFCQSLLGLHVVNTFMGYYTEDFVIILAKAQLNLKLLSHASFAFLCLLFVTDSDFIFWIRK